MAYLEMKSITKRFDHITALDSVDLSIEKGEVHVLLGENGAGKTTLMNILYAVYKKTAGRIFLDGEELNLRNSKHAIERGIGMVHQHFMLIPDLTVIENILLPHKSNKGILKVKEKAKKFVDFACSYGIEVDPMAMVRTLTVGQQQRIEILKALYAGAELLILDEPTAVLTPQEVDSFFDMLKNLVAQGLTIIFITHKLAEVMKVADRCTVLRGGKKIATVSIDEIDEPYELATMMVGSSLDSQIHKAAMTPKAEVLKVENLSYIDENKVERLSNVSFTVQEHQILGICGVDGNGQSELVKCVTGLLNYKEGNVSISGKDIKQSNSKEIIRSGVSHIPEDRQQMGMVAEMTVNENLILMCYEQPPYSRHGFINWKWTTSYNQGLCKEYDVRTTGVQAVASTLSGGNQQKLVVARELNRIPKLLVAMHPTRGLDIGATKSIQDRLLGERERGAGILFVSTELDEIMALSDYILVIYSGRSMGIYAQDEVTREQLGLLMAGLQIKSNAATQGIC